MDTPYDLKFYFNASKGLITRIGSGTVKDLDWLMAKAAVGVQAEADAEDVSYWREQTRKARETVRALQEDVQILKDHLADVSAKTVSPPIIGSR